MAVTHDAVAAIRQFHVFPHGAKGIRFGCQHLSQHSAGAFSCKFAQRIVDGLRLTQCLATSTTRKRKDWLIGWNSAHVHYEVHFSGSAAGVQHE